MDNIKERIRALMSKTVDNGCTEEEAIAASQKAQELLHKCQLSLDDISLGESQFRQGIYDTTLKTKPPIHYVAGDIAYFTDTKVWFTSDGSHKYHYFGMDHDVLIAEYITKICDWAMIWGAEDFKDTDAYNDAPKGPARSKLKMDFQMGMAVRLGRRLREMKDSQRKMDIEGSGRDLVVVKTPLVEKAFKKEDIHLRNTRSRGRRVNDLNAYEQGKQAADRVNINPGVGAQEARRELK